MTGFGSARRQGESNEVPRTAAELLPHALSLLLEEEAPAAIADPEGRLLHANAGAKRLLPLLALASGGDPEKIPDVEAALAAPGPAGGWGQPLEREQRISAGATIEIYRASLRVFRDESGQPLALLARWRAFSDAAELRRQLADTAERFEDISRLVSDWIWETDRNLSITFVSPRALEATGFHPRSLIGRPLASLFVKGKQELAPLEREDGRHPFRNLELPLKHGDGGERLFCLAGVPVYARDSGAFRGFRGVAQDVTALRAREAALLRSKELAEGASRAKSEFLATVSHELRTPLNAIIGFSELMQAETFGPLGSPTYCEYARDIHQSASHLLELINDILDVSKMEAGKMELEAERIDPVAIARATVRLVAERAAQSKISLSLALPEGLPALWADARAIRQILLNLLANAVKFTPEGGNVSLSAELDKKGDWLFVIQDSGIGMTAAEIDIALTPFGQVDSRLARRFPGTGLGLPLSKGLVELHGGRLEIDSISGVGTRVLVRLPSGRVLPD